jgi:nucleotidyltransferase substrate binding protein (TIGR01987 family)
MSQNIISGFEAKFLNYEKALDKLQASIAMLAKDPDNEYYRDSVLKRYEFTWELAWKTLKEHLEESGLEFTPSPLNTLKEAYQVNLIDNIEEWQKSVKGRNLLSHTYDEELSNLITSEIINKYNQIFKTLYDKLKPIYDNSKK